MKITEILQAYHSMPACDRLDLICRMVRHCIPYEIRFLGTILLDEARSQSRADIAKLEVNANRVNYYSSMQESGLSHDVCEKLCCALAVLNSNNHPVAEVIFNMLNDNRVMAHFEESNDLRVMQDFRLLYVMAVNHPALLFNQRQHLMYTYLQRMDSIFLEKCKYSFSGSFSGSMEKTLSYEGENAKYPPEGHFKDISPDAYIVRCEVHSVYKRTTDKRYAYMIQVEWSDGFSYTVRRTYGDFFSFQTKLLDLFPEESGQKGKKHPRLIPYLPGKNYSKFLKNRDVAEKRLPELHRYSRELVSLPERVTRCSHVLEFFKPKPTDLKEDYPAFHKITTLYDLVESGKVRSSRVLPDSLKNSPSNSPILQHHGSPLLRAMHNSGATPTDPSSSSPRSSHTLPPASSAATPPTNHEVLPRRPTYPLSRQLQKSETSAFTPVGKSPLNEDDLTSTVTLTASVISMPGSTSNYHSTTMPTISQDTPTTTQATPSDSSTAGTFTYAESADEPRNSSSVPLPTSSGEVTSLGCTDPQLSRITQPPAHEQANGGESCYVVSGGCGDVPMTTAHQEQSMAIWRHVQMEISPNAQVMGVSAEMIAPPLSSASPTQHVTSPTMLNSPLLTSTFSPPLIPPMASPSPTHSGASTPRGGVTYPQQMLYPQQYNPSFYFIGTTSPLPSPLASPKTSSRWQGSYSSVNQPIIEYDSLLKWLKSLRLHKYHQKFENLTYEEFCQMTVEEFEKRGMTTGAAKKLHKKLEELQVCNFAGFRDMPFSGGMSRKLSTCSLPAALLMEQAMTPSSSCDRFSPTGSTCSLDKYSHSTAGGGGRVLSSMHSTIAHHSTHEVTTRARHSSQSEPGTALANGGLVGTSGARMSDNASRRNIPSPPGKGNGSLASSGPYASNRAPVNSSTNGSVTSSSRHGSGRHSTDPGTGSACNGPRDPGSGGSGPRDPGSAGSGPRDPGSAGNGPRDPGSGGSGPRDPGSGGSGPRSAGNGPRDPGSGGSGPRDPGSGGSGPRSAGSGPRDPGSGGSSRRLRTDTGSPTLSTSNWADAGEDLVPASKADWARIPFSNGESLSGGSEVQSHSSTGTKPLISSIPGHVSIDSTGLLQLHHSHLPTATRPGPTHNSTQHGGYHAHHSPNGKRNSHNSGGGSGHNSDSSDIVAPQPLHPRNQVGVANPNWNKSVRPPSFLPANMAILHAQSQQQQQQQRMVHHGGHIHHNQNNSNGLMRTPIIATPSRAHNIVMLPTGGMVAYTGPPAVHGHAPPPVVCYNCGKRGHLGNTCPGVTVDVADTSSFNKQLEKLLHVEEPGTKN